jgi:hypothetical protein
MWLYVVLVTKEDSPDFGWHSAAHNFAVDTFNGGFSGGRVK